MNQENVIEVSFNQQSQVAQELESLLELEDPIEELLSEFDEEIKSMGLEEPELRASKVSDFKLSYTDTSRHMTDVLLSQMQHIQEDIQRLSYYLDEMNIDK